MKDMNIACQRTLCCTATAPIRKHIPVQTIFTLRPAQTVTADKRNVYSRNLEKRQMGEASGEINQILQNIEYRHLNVVEERIEAFIREAMAPRKQRQRRVKAWFDAECHAASATTTKLLHEAREAPDREALHQYMNSRTKYKMLSKKRKAFTMRSKKGSFRKQSFPSSHDTATPVSTRHPNADLGKQF
jgi:ParB-like chromosome segregation protein Spo0J